MTAPTELVKGNASLLILSCLAQEPMHGYRITKEIERTSEGYFALGEGTLYPHLHQLEKDGFVEGYWESTPGGRERKYYRITDKGCVELTRRKAEWARFQSKMNNALQLSPDALCAH